MNVMTVRRHQSTKDFGFSCPERDKRLWCQGVNNVNVYLKSAIITLVIQYNIIANIASVCEWLIMTLTFIIESKFKIWIHENPASWCRLNRKNKTFELC